MRLGAALIILAACGGTGARAQEPLPTEGPADIAAMRALLQRYSPVQYAIVTTYESLPGKFTIDGGESTISHAQTFADWFRDGAAYNTVEQLDTSIHESFHAYSGSMGLQLVSEQGRYGDGVRAVLVDDDPYLLRFTPTFPARDTAETFPAGARTFRHEVYVLGDSSTQIDGVYGYLDEWCAYYHGNHTALDLWPWVRDEAPRHERVIGNYVATLHKIQMAHAEFKLFILHYLLHAKEHEPEIYDALLANATFRRAYVEIDAAYAALVEASRALEPEVHAFARASGVDPAGYLLMEDGFAGVVATLVARPYVEMDAALR